MVDATLERPRPSVCAGQKNQENVFSGVGTTFLRLAIGGCRKLTHDEPVIQPVDPHSQSRFVTCVLCRAIDAI